MMNNEPIHGISKFMGGEVHVLFQIKHIKDIIHSHSIRRAVSKWNIKVTRIFKI